MADALVFKMEGVTGLQKFMLNYRKEKKKRVQRATLINAHRIREGYKQNLSRLKVHDKGNLKKSIRVDTRDGWRSAEIGATMTYAPYVEKGSSPHFPPPKALYEWVRRKAMKSGHHIRGGKRPPKSARGRGRLENEIHSIAFAIARHISKHGVKARPALLPAAKKILPIYMRDIRNAFK